MLDKKAKSERLKSLSVPVNERNIPELYEPSYLDEEKDVQKWLERCDEDGIITLKYRDRWNGSPLYRRKASIIFNEECSDECREILGLHINNEKSLWEDAVNSSNLPLETKSSLLLSSPIKITNKSSEEIIEHISEFLLLPDEFRLVRQASAWMFWGVSKILDSRPDIISLLGLKQPPIQISVHLSSSEKLKILFIENSQTFEYAKRKTSVFDDFTLVYISGYMGTAKRTRNIDGSSLYFSKDGELKKDAIEYFSEWFYGESSCEVYLWGDFDYEGISIYLSLQKIFPEVRLWKPAYSQMIEAAKAKGHSIDEAKKGKQIKPKHTGVAYIDNEILPIMEKHGFFDQEGLIF